MGLQKDGKENKRMKDKDKENWNKNLKNKKKKMSMKNHPKTKSEATMIKIMFIWFKINEKFPYLIMFSF